MVAVGYRNNEIVDSALYRYSKFRQNQHHATSSPMKKLLIHDYCDVCHNMASAPSLSNFPCVMLKSWKKPENKGTHIQLYTIV